MCGWQRKEQLAKLEADTHSYLGCYSHQERVLVRSACLVNTSAGQCPKELEVEGALSTSELGADALTQSSCCCEIVCDPGCQPTACQ